MKFELGSVAILLAFVGTVNCVNFGSLFGFLTNVTKPNEAIASNCKIFNRRRRCKFNTKSIKLDTADVIELVVNTAGRKIKCNKALKKGKRWYGNCDGDADDANFVTRSDKDGEERVYGSISVGDDVCRIGPNVRGEEEIVCTNKNQFKPEDVPKEPPKDEIPGKRMLASDGVFGFTPLPNGSKSPTALLRNGTVAQRRELFDDSGSNLDVLVVWTKKAECQNAGFAIGCNVNDSTENLMRGLIDLAVAETNTAYELSGILTRLRLVHAYRDPDYVESGDFNSALYHLTEVDGYMDSAHTKRQLYGADIVHVIVGEGQYCGVAWSGTPSANYMFGVTSYDCATGFYTFGHEIGHNLGMFHDRGVENTCSELNTFNYGYRNPNAEFRTILAYSCQVGQCDAMPKNGCTRIQRFSNSNPAFTYNGKPIGTTRHDNARQLNNVRATVARFFPAMDCKINSECNDNDPTTIDTCNVPNGVCVFTPRPATNAPVKPPTSAPVKPPTSAPASSPVKPPTKAPVQPSTSAPVQLTAAPTKIPTRRPSKAPTLAPMEIRTNAPVRTPTKAPTKAPVPLETFFMESMVITGVTSSWKVVSFSKMYVSPIPVCTVRYDQGTAKSPAVVRLQRVGPTSMDVRIQNPSDANLASVRDVHCVIVEEGAWKLPDGRLIESKKYSSTVTDRKGSFAGQAQTYRNTYTNPVVLGQVMSHNDAKWSVFWCRSSVSAGTAPSATSLITGKHIGEDTRTTRLAETVGYIVIEAGHATSNNVELETGRGPDSFIGYVNSKKTLLFRSRFASTPSVAILSQVAMDESDGSWAVLTSGPTTTGVGVSVDEDQLSDRERKHTTEEVHYAVFSGSGAIQLNKI